MWSFIIIENSDWNSPPPPPSTHTWKPTKKTQNSNTPLNSHLISSSPIALTVFNLYYCNPRAAL